MMKQKQYVPLNVAEIAISLFAVENGYCDNVLVSDIISFESGLHNFVKDNYSDLMLEINNTGKYDANVEKTFNSILQEYKKLR